MNNLNKHSRLETKWLDRMDSVACIQKSILYVKKCFPSITEYNRHKLRESEDEITGKDDKINRKETKKKDERKIST